MGAPYLITLPAMYTDLQTGELLEPAELTDGQWQCLGDGHSELGRILHDEHGVRQMFHPHADAHVDGNASIDRFLALTDPATVSLCLDTGHVAYVGGDNRAVVASHPDRIGYVHLKSVDPDVLAEVRADGVSFARAVQEGAMVEPDRGEPAMPPLLADLNALGVPLTAIVEHDIYPAPAGAPLPIATRTRRYYTAAGWLLASLPGRGGAAPEAGVMRVSVEVSGWEIECCVPSPGVGDRVSWPLEFHSADPEGWDRPAPESRWWRAERRDDGAVLLVDGPLVALWSQYRQPAPPPGVLQATGVLVVTVHGGSDDLPAVSGRVRRLWVRSQVYVPATGTGSRYRGPVAGTLTLREVDRSPRWFSSGSPSAEGPTRVETGLLVELEIDEAAPPPA